MKEGLECLFYELSDSCENYVKSLDVDGLVGSYGFDMYDRYIELYPQVLNIDGVRKVSHLVVDGGRLESKGDFIGSIVREDLIVSIRDRFGNFKLDIEYVEVYDKWIPIMVLLIWIP